MSLRKRKRVDPNELKTDKLDAFIKSISVFKPQHWKDIIEQYKRLKSQAKIGHRSNELLQKFCLIKSIVNNEVYDEPVLSNPKRIKSNNLQEKLELLLKSPNQEAAKNLMNVKNHPILPLNGPRSHRGVLHETNSIEDQDLDVSDQPIPKGNSNESVHSNNSSIVSAPTPNHPDSESSEDEDSESEAIEQEESGHLDDVVTMLMNCLSNGKLKKSTQYNAKSIFNLLAGDQGEVVGYKRFGRFRKNILEKLVDNRNWLLRCKKFIAGNKSIFFTFSTRKSR